MSTPFIVALSAAALVLGGLVLACTPLLLRWYLRVIRRMDIAEDPGEAIVTYPLA